MIPNEGGDRFGGNFFVGGAPPGADNLNPRLEALGVRGPAGATLYDVNGSFGGPIPVNSVKFLPYWTQLDVSIDPCNGVGVWRSGRAVFPVLAVLPNGPPVGRETLWIRGDLRWVGSVPSRIICRIAKLCDNSRKTALLVELVEVTVVLFDPFGIRDVCPDARLTEASLLEPRPISPWRKSPLHSSGDPSRLTALLLGQICPIFSLVAPCQAGVSPLSVQRGVSPRAAIAVCIQCWSPDGRS